MRLIQSIFICIMVTGGLQAQNVSTEDFSKLLGEKWSGTLTYLDYSSNKLTSIPVKISVSQIKDKLFELAYFYTDEPQANSKTKIALKDGGKRLNKEEVQEFTSGSNGETVIQTMSYGKDNGKKATFIKTYTFSASDFSIRKDVIYDAGGEQFMRNEYKLSR